VRYGADGVLRENQQVVVKSSKGLRRGLADSQAWLFYRLDVLMEQHPVTSIVLLALLTLSWVIFGGVIW
jgi:hypothetical protein